MEKVTKRRSITGRRSWASRRSNDRRLARLKISRARFDGVNEDGPNRQKRLKAPHTSTSKANVLTYLSVKGTHELLDGKGQTAGRDRRAVHDDADGGREDAGRPLADASLRDLDLKPNGENDLPPVRQRRPGCSLPLRARLARRRRCRASRSLSTTARLGGGILDHRWNRPSKVPSAGRLPQRSHRVPAERRRRRGHNWSTEKPKRVRAPNRFNSTASLSTPTDRHREGDGSSTRC